MGYYNKFTTSAVVTIILLVVGHLGGGSVVNGDPICGGTPARDQKAFAGNVDCLLDTLVKGTAKPVHRISSGALRYTASCPFSGSPGSATGTATCSDKGDDTVSDCAVCLKQLLPYLQACETTSSTGGAFYEGCKIQFWEN